MAMRTLLVISGYWPSQADPISGIFVVEQIRAFVELGYRVHVVVGQAIGRPIQRLDLATLGLPEDRVTLLTPRFLRAPERVSLHPLVFAANMQGTAAFIRSALAQLRANGTSPDACLVHGLRYAIPAAPLWKPMLDAPAVGLIHGVDPVLDRAPLPPRIVTWLRRGVATMDAVGMVGSYLKDHLAAAGLDPSGLHLALNGTEVPPENTLSPVQADAPPRRLLSVARLVDWKGIDDVLQALAVLKASGGAVDWHYRIVGKGPEQGRLQALAARLGLASQVSFLGHLSRSDTLAEFDACDLFVLPSWAEPFGIVYLEAMARRRPIIGCNNCGPADFVVSGQDGLLVPPKSPGALADALRGLWQDPARAAALGRAGRKTAEALSWRRNARQIAGMLGIA